MKTSELRNHKAPEAAAERFGRAVAAIMKYNDSVELPELRWYINSAVITGLVGGAPSIAKDWLKSRPDVAEHHKKYNLTPGFNRRGVLITERVTVPELPVVATAETATDENQPVENDEKVD